MKSLIVVLFMLLGSVGVSHAEPLVKQQQVVKGCSENCTFVIFSEAASAYQAVNKSRAKQLFTPYSSFKIVNSLIAFETGVVADTVEKLSFSQNNYPIESWWPKVWYLEPLSIKDAFKYSAVPIYRELAIKIGQSTMQTWLNQLDYGNSDISSGLDSFWLNGSLQISANQQVFFLRRLLNNRLPASTQAIAKLKSIMLVEQGKDYKLYAKTGGGPLNANSTIGWYVGFVENQQGLHYFALNLEGKSFAAIKDKRIKIARYYLAQTGVI